MSSSAVDGVMTTYQDPEDLLVVEAVGGDVSTVDQQLPQTFVQHGKADVLALNDPSVNLITDEEARMKALAKYVSPSIQTQLRKLSDKPIIATPDKILNAVLPPRTFIAHDSTTGTDILMAQPVSDKQITRPELADLLYNFELRLRESKSRLTGICPVRSTINAMLFDELIRQTTIDLPERGLLLLRIRDEARMTIDTWKSLHEAGSQYGDRKLHETTRGNPELRAKIEKLSAERDALVAEQRRLEAQKASLERCVDEQVQADHKRYNEEKSFLDSSNRRLQQHLDTVKHLQEQERKALLGES